MIRYAALALVLIPGLVFFSCSAEHGDSPAGFSFEAPEAPTGLTLTPGANQLTLEWDYPGDPADVSGYVVYYYYDMYGVEEVIDTVTATRYTDSDLIGNMIYCYKVSAIGPGDREGYRSATKCAMAGD